MVEDKSRKSYVSYWRVSTTTVWSDLWGHFVC